MRGVKTIVAKVLERAGYQISALDRPTPGFRRGLMNLARVMTPASVIDCGVADGTRDLYSAFPGCAYLLVEANPVYRHAVATLAARLGGQYELVFVGAAPGLETIRAYEDARKTSRYQTTWQQRLVEESVVPVDTLDNLVLRHRLPRPFLLKLDIEGAELSALAGARAMLADTIAVVTEVALVDKFVGGPQLADVVSDLRDLGFVVFDIFGGVPGRRGGLSQVDVVFVPADSPARGV